MSTSIKRTSRLSIAAAMGALAIATAPAAWAASADPATQTVTITVPDRLAITIDSSTRSIDVDPTVAGDYAEVLNGATVTLKANVTGATLKIQATQPTSGSNTIPFANFQFKVGTVVNGTDATHTLATGAGAYQAFTGSAQDLMTINTRTDGTVAPCAYQVKRSWQYAAGNYTSTVTFTLTAP